jgi:hypothetical protein
MTCLVLANCDGAVTLETNQTLTGSAASEMWQALALLGNQPNTLNAKTKLPNALAFLKVAAEKDKPSSATV